jgi:hypothetical protein
LLGILQAKGSDRLSVKKKHAFKLKGKALLSETGGVYDAMVLFKGNRATIFFVNGDQLALEKAKDWVLARSGRERNELHLGAEGIGSFHFDL